MASKERVTRARVRHFTHPIRQITLQIPPEWLTLIDNHADARGITRAMLLREIIEAWVDADTLSTSARADPP
jgi:predicted DNA binding CopG/RHH family protein